MLVIPLGLLLLSVRLLNSGSKVRRDVGGSLLTGSIVAFAVFALQVHLDSQRRGEEGRDQFRLSVAFAQDLKELKPQFSLSGMYLSGKDMDNAELQQQDLSDANLQGASLRGADLEGANLTGANLYGANLRGSSIVDTDLTGADLRATRLGVKFMNLPPEPSDFRGTKVNAFTCWPDDFLANVHYPPESDLRKALTREPVKVHGRTIVERQSPRSWGRACVLEDENIWEDVFLYAPKHDLAVVRASELRRTVHELAVTFGRSASKIFARLDGGRPMRYFGQTAPSIQRRLCAGTSYIEARAGDLTKAGFGGLVVWPAGQSIDRAVAIPQPEDEPGSTYLVRFGHPLQAGTKISLTVEKPVTESKFGRFSLQRRVRAC
jgi:hypothetical protein